MGQNEGDEQSKPNEQGGSEPRGEIPEHLLRRAGARDSREREEGRRELGTFLESKGVQGARGESERLGRLAATGRMRRAKRLGERLLGESRPKERRE